MYKGEGHLTDEDAERFANGEMDDVEMPDADLHQANCDDCHNLVNAKAQLAHARREAIAAEMGDQRSDLDYLEDPFEEDEVISDADACEWCGVNPCRCEPED